MSSARIRIVDSGDGRLHLRWWADDTVQWHQILDSFKARFPTHHDRSYSPHTRTWSVPRSRYERLAQWADYWFHPDDQEWLDEEPAGGYGHTYSRSGYSQYSRRQTSTTTIEAAFAQLHLLPSAPAWAAEAVYKAAVKVHHPDAGGDGQVMTAINLAMEAIREYTEEKAS